MAEARHRGVTRGYVAALIAATCVVAVALVVASWGAITLGLGSSPVTSEEVPRWAAPVIVVVAVAFLAASLWQQTLTLLRGQRGPAWAHVVVLAGCTYLLWCLAGTVTGMTLSETWLSPYTIALVVSWVIANLGFWGVLARRVFTDKPAPKWPWERAEEEDAS